MTGRRWTIELRELPWPGIHKVDAYVRLRQALKMLKRVYAIEAGAIHEKSDPTDRHDPKPPECNQ